MKWDCARVDDAISDWARGIELPEGARSHIAECPICAQALEEARAFGELVKCADSVPAAPDCRSAVMARISKPRRSAWIYAWAAVPMAIAIILVILMLPARQIPTPRQTISRQSPLVVHQAPKVAPTVKPEAPKPTMIATAITGTGHHHRRVKRHTVVHQPKPVPTPAVEPQPEEPIPVCVVKPSEPDTPPVAMVYVTWDKPNTDKSFKCVVTESKPQTAPQRILMNGGTNDETIHA